MTVAVVPAALSVVLSTTDRLNGDGESAMPEGVRSSKVNIPAGAVVLAGQLRLSRGCSERV